MLLCAQDDILTPPYFSHELARMIPGARLVELEGGGHCVSETVPREFDEAVLHFIERYS